MNAQQMLLDYANKHIGNTKSVETPQKFIGQAITEGIVISRTSNSRTVAHVKREGKTIIVTETLKVEQAMLVDGKRVYAETVTEIFRVNV
jgi:hypothetical protein